MQVKITYNKLWELV